MTNSLVRVAALVTFPFAVAVAQSGGHLVSSQNVVRRYDAAGAMQQTIPVPHPAGVRPPTEVVRDVVVDANGDLWAFNGTFSPWLSVRRASTGEWQHHQHPQWSATNGGSNGGLAVYEGKVFVAGDQTAFVPGAILRFDPATAAFVVFGTQFALGFTDLTLGWDGKLYALSQSGQHVEVFDPVSLQHVRSIALPHALMARGIGVLPNGDLVLATWEQGLQRRDADGNLLAALATPGFSLHDLDLDACGNLWCGERFGRVLRSTAELAGFTVTAVTGTNTFVAFAQPTVPQPAAASVRLGVPPNPAVFTGAGARLGTMWSGAIAPFVPGAFADVVVFGAGPANVPSVHGTLLFDEALTHFVYDAAGGSVIEVWIPNDCRLHGLTFVAQAGSVSNAEVRVGNALDVRISAF
jgi:hypothetical protein